jgi:hypothetical protein
MTDLGPPRELLRSGSANVRQFLTRGDGDQTSTRSPHG